MAYFDLKRTGLQYMFNLRGNNNEVVLTSERYGSKEGALNGIASVRAHSPFDHNYQRLTNTALAPYFVLRAGNREAIGVSEAYSSAHARDQGIEWTKVNAPWAPIRDNT